MSNPELIANSPIPGSSTPIATLATAVITTPVAGTIETWTFNSAPPAALQATGQYRFTIDSEICIDVTGGAGASRQIQRGAEGSTVATHLQGAGIYHGITAGGLAAYVAANGAGGVTSFNTRSGAVALSKADVTGTGVAAADVGAIPTTDKGANSGVMALDAGGVGAQPPKAHAASHAPAGSDPLVTADLPTAAVVVPGAGTVSNVPLDNGDGTYHWGAQSGGGAPVTGGTISGGTSSTALSTTAPPWKTGTLTADHVATITSVAAGATCRFDVTQDATGGRTFTITDGSTTKVADISTLAASVSTVIVTASSASVWALQVIATSQQRQRGYLGQMSSFRFRGAWAASTAYSRGDIIIDPKGVPRWCWVAHTSGSSFKTGTEYSGNSPAAYWGLVPTNGPFRGLWTAAHNATYGTQYSPGDLIINPNTNEIERVLFMDTEASGATYTQSNYADFGIYPPFALIDPGLVMAPAGMPTSAPHQGMGFYQRRTRIQYPHVKPAAVWNTGASFTSVSGGSAGVDLDPIDPNGNPTLPFVSSPGVIATQTLGSTVDLTKNIVRLPIKLQGANGSRGQTTKQLGVLGTTLGTGSPITSIPLDTTGLWFGVANGTQIILDDGAGHTQTFTCSDWVSASGSCTSIPVTSLTPTFAFPSGTTTVNLMSRNGITSCQFQVSSDGFATTAAFFPIHQHNLNVDEWAADTAWSWVGAGPGNWTVLAGKSMPTMSAINSVRFVNIGTGGTWTLSVSRMDVLPNNGQTGSAGDGRAKCVLWCDDSYVGHWAYILGQSIQYGFPVCTATAGAIDSALGSTSSLNVTQLQYMAHFHRWQQPLHYYFPNDAGDDQLKDGPGKDAFIQRGKHSLAGSGTWGQDHFAWHDDDRPSWQNLPIHRKNFATNRGYSAFSTSTAFLWYLETLPPRSTDLVACYGMVQSDALGRQVATTSGTLTGGTPITSIPITTGAGNGLAVDVAAGEIVLLPVQTLTGNLVKNSASVTALSVSMPVGGVYDISGTGIALGSTITITGSGTTGTLSIAATANGTGNTLSLSQRGVVSTYTAAGTGVSSIPINSVTPASTINAGAVVNNPASDMKRAIANAIANAGLVQFAWENVTSPQLDVQNVMLYLDQNRASIDVVTIAEAVKPWVTAV